jgi:Uma2 family endonuclease
MSIMSRTAAEEILAAAEHLRNGARLIVPHVTWDEYERLLENLPEAPHLRLSYDCGRLEIVSTSPEHEAIVRLVEDLVLIYCLVFQLKLYKFGETTWKRRAKEKGAESDACYYIKDTERIARKKSFDLETDPPPDIIVEIDITNDSSSKFSIYAALSVPEVWLYDGKAFVFYERDGDSYAPIANSRFLPMLTASLLTQSVRIMEEAGQPEAREAFLRQIESLR